MILLILLEAIILVGFILNIIEWVMNGIFDFLEWALDKFERHRRDREKRRWERMRNE